jgi:hypothetical protein
VNGYIRLVWPDGRGEIVEVPEDVEDVEDFLRELADERWFAESVLRLTS